MKKYYPDGDPSTAASTSMAIGVAQTLVQVLKQCGDDLTRENVMKQAANLKDFAVADGAAGHQDQHQPDRLRADPGHAVRALRRQDSGGCSAT